MRKTGFAGFTLVALLALGIVSAPAAVAAPTTTSCTNTALVRPLLGAPSCTTAPQVCPANSRCSAVMKLTAARLVGLGRATAKVTLFAVDAPDVNVSEECSGTNRCTAERAGTVRTGPAQDGAYAARCEWTGNAVGILAQVGCSLTQESIESLPQ